jgi:hypothetical protein
MMPLCVFGWNQGPVPNHVEIRKGERDAVVILLCGGDKGSQDRDIEHAKDYWRDHRSRSHG